MVDPLEQASVAPCVEVALDAAVGREDAGQRSPLTARPKQVEDRYEKQTPRSFAWASRGRRIGKERRNQRPRLIGDQGLTPTRNGRSFISNGGVGHLEAPGKESPI